MIRNGERPTCRMPPGPHFNDMLKAGSKKNAVAASAKAKITHTVTQVNGSKCSQ